MIYAFGTIKKKFTFLPHRLEPGIMKIISKINMIERY